MRQLDPASSGCSADEVSVSEGVVVSGFLAGASSSGVVTDSDGVSTGVTGVTGSVGSVGVAGSDCVSSSAG